MKKKYSILMLVISFGLFLTSCYKEFDPNSYKPAFEIGGFSSVKQIKTSNLVGYWAFEGGLIDSVSGAAATNNGTTFVNGFKGKGVGFNVTNTSYILINSTPAITTGLQSFTVSFWVNPTFVDNGSGAIAGILGLVTLSNVSQFWGNLEWFVQNGSTPSSTTIQLHVWNGNQEFWIVKNGVTNLFGTWSNHTLTYDATTSTFTYYMNGASIGTYTPAWTGGITFTNSGPYVLGCDQFQTTPSLTSSTGSQPWASYLTGTMDELRIYNAALSANEVNAMVVLQGKGK